MDDTPARFVEQRSEQLVETTLDLVGFDTQNPPGETSAIVDYVEDVLLDLGLHTDVIAEETAHPGIVAWFPEQPAPKIVFNGHLDTVPFDASEWSVDPLGERDGTAVYGRGATDMKGAVAAMLLAARWFASNDPPPVGFAFTSNEEVAGSDQLHAALDQFATEPARCVIGEMTGTPERPSAAVADKGSIWVTLTATGEQAHGSRPMFGENAVDRLYETVTTLETELDAVPFQLDPEVRPLVEQSIDYYATEVGERAARDLFESPTMNLGMLSGGDAINSVPASATAKLDIRLTASVDPEPFVDRIRSFIDCRPAVEIASLEYSEGTYEPLDTPLVAAIQRAGSTTVPILARSATGGGDAKTLRNRGISTVEFSLGTETAHAVDERTTVPALCRTATIYASLPAALSADDTTDG